MTRRRYVYTQGGVPLAEPYEVSADWRQPDADGGHKSEEEIYGKVQATDGSDLSTRKRHREYMKANGLTIADDFRGSWEQAEKERAAVFRGDFDHRARREAIGRAHYEVTHGRRNRK